MTHPVQHPFWSWLAGLHTPGLVEGHGACEAGDTRTVPMEHRHLPVLRNAVVAALLTRSRVRILDGTFGGGGHSRALLDGAEGSTVTALDCDPEAEARAAPLSAAFPDRFAFRSANFADLDRVEGAPWDGVLLDLGVSSFQLDQGERGFSFRADAPLDMRMNPREGQSAADFLETAERPALVHAVRDLGEEPQWRRIVEALWQARGTGRLQRTGSVAELVAAAAPPRRPGRRSLHPATLTFQGLRMAVNRELELLEAALPKAFASLGPGGRLAVIAFHSLEDRIVKRFFRRMAGHPEHRHDYRTQDERAVQAQLLTRKPLTPEPGEVQENPRARSARLRVLEKHGGRV